MANRLFTQEEKNQMYKMASEGSTYKIIANAFHTYPGTVHTLLDRDFGFRKTRSWSSTVSIPENPTDVAYIAGIFDGEGSIYEQISKNRPEGSNKWWIVKITMTDREVIEYLAQFGGKFSIEKKPENRKEAYCWRVSRKEDLKILLPALLPYIKVPSKKQRVLQAISELI